MILFIIQNILDKVFDEYDFHYQYRLIDKTLYFSAFKIARGHGFNFGYTGLIQDLITEIKAKSDEEIIIVEGGVSAIDRNTLIARFTGYINNITMS